MLNINTSGSFCLSLFLFLFQINVYFIFEIFNLKIFFHSLLLMFFILENRVQ